MAKKKENRVSAVRADRTAVQDPNAYITWAVQPMRSEETLATVWHWVSNCGRYRISRRQSRYQGMPDRYVVGYLKMVQGGRGSVWDSVEWSGDGTAKGYRSLAAAIERLNRHHRDTTGRSHLTTNEDAVLAQAVRDGLAEFIDPTPPPQPHTTPGPAAKTTQPKKEKQLDGPKDFFGSPVGSDKAKVNAVLTKTPKSMKQIVKEAGVKQTYYNHLKLLMEAEVVVKTEAGFALK